MADVRLFRLTTGEDIIGKYKRYLMKKVFLRLL